jgi:hypothetical protein
VLIRIEPTIIFQALVVGFLLSAIWCMANGRFNEAAYSFMAGSYYVLAFLYVYRYHLAASSSAGPTPRASRASLRAG